MRFVPKLKAQELAKACAVLLHAMYNHEMMLIPFLSKCSDNDLKLCNTNGYTLIRDNWNIKQSHSAFSSRNTYIEFSWFNTNNFTVFELGKGPIREERIPIVLTSLPEEEEFQRSLVLTDIEMYSLEFFKECIRLEVPNMYMVLGQLCTFMNENEKLYHSLEKRYDEFCITK